MYSHVFVAGTFDRLHKGHEAILRAAFAEGERVTIGLTSDDFVKKYKTNISVGSFEKRKQYLEEWLKEKKYTYTIIPIDDPIAPADTASFDALIVTSVNRDRGEEINKQRSINGLKIIDLVEIPMVAAQDAQPISSTRIRNGEIDQIGRLILPDNLRPELSKPLGNVLNGDAIGSSIENHRSGIIITVGDITTTIVLTAGVVSNLLIIDFLVNRKQYETNIDNLQVYRKNIVSGPGYIAKDAIAFIQKWRMHPTEKVVLVVTGEEDLLTLPAVAYGPLGAVVYYGQPNHGLVEVVITDEKQREATTLLAKFTQQ